MYRLHAFGAPHLQGLQGQVPGTGPRRLALLAAVCAAGPRGLTRDKVTGLLWPDAEPEKARHALAQTLYALRRELGVDVVTGAAELRVDPAQLTSDIADFDAALARGEPGAALALYEGPFLDGFYLTGAADFERWAETERDRRWRQAIAAAADLAKHAETRADRSGAVVAWRRAAELDPASGRIAASLMQALVQSGDRAGAIQHADAHAAWLDRELRMSPEAAVLALSHRLRAEPATAPPDGAPSSTTAPSTASAASARAETAPAGAASQSPSPSNNTATGASAAPRRGTRLLTRVGIAAGSVLALGMVAWWVLPARQRAGLRTLISRPPSHLVARRVAVAPLENRTGDSTLTAVGELAADWITQGLSDVGEFEVVDAPTAAIAQQIVDRIPRMLRAGDRDVALAEETGAGRLIKGALYLRGDSIAAVVQVLETGTGRQLRSLAMVTARRADVAGLVQELRRRTVGALMSAVDTTSVGMTAGLAAPPDYEAYVEARRAWEAFYRGEYDEVFQHIDRALAIDGTYMAPLLMRAYVLTRLRRWPEADSVLGVARARRATLTQTERAVLDVIDTDIAGDLPGRLQASRELMRLTPASTEGFTLGADVALMLGRPRDAVAFLAGVDPERGLLLFAPFYWQTIVGAKLQLRDYDEAAALAQRGIRQFPTDGYLRYLLVMALAGRGDARGAIDAARDVAPGSANPEHDAASRVTGAALVLRARGDTAIARRLFDSLSTSLEPPTTDSAYAPQVRWLRARILMEVGLVREARAELLAAAPAFVGDEGYAGWLGVMAARLGDSAAARATRDSLAGLPGRYRHGRHLWWSGHLAAALGQRDDAVAYLRAALREGYPVTADDDLWPSIDPDFAGLRRYPPFEALFAPR